MNICGKCNYLHYATDPCKIGPRNPVAKVDDDVKVAPVDRGTVSRKVKPVKTAEAESVSRGVDARSSTATSEVMDATAGETATNFDKKAWMRDYMREHRRGIRRRAKLKEAGK